MYSNKYSSKKAWSQVRLDWSVATHKATSFTKQRLDGIVLIGMTNKRNVIFRYLTLTGFDKVNAKFVNDGYKMLRDREFSYKQVQVQVYFLIIYININAHAPASSKANWGGFGLSKLKESKRNTNLKNRIVITIITTAYTRVT